MARYISVARIRPNPQQPRRVFEDGALEEMAVTIKRHGVIQPIVVYREGDQYILIDGERRWRAARLAGKLTIPADIRRRPGGGKRKAQSRLRLEQALVANLQREDMSPVEEGDAFIALMEKHKLSQTDVARRVGIHPLRVNTSVALARTDNEIRALLQSGELYRNVDLVRALMKIPDRDVRIQMAQKLAARKSGLKASVRAANLAAETCARSGKGDKSESPAVKYAAAKRKVTGEPRNWDALRQLGKVPPWEKVVQAANLTCRHCSLADIASPEQCGECPAVDLLGLLMSEAA